MQFVLLFPLFLNQIRQVKLMMQITSLGSTVMVVNQLDEAFNKIFSIKNYISGIYILVDENTKKFCLPALLEIENLKNASIIEVQAGEEHKSIETVVRIWSVLTDTGADRHSLLLILGGGVLGDLGGFAASTFKRGIEFINIPTTLLAQLDASIGGKMGFNFKGYKNEIGLFHSPDFVIIYPNFLQTLTQEMLKSGFAEMIKHALISSEEHWSKIKTFDTNAFDISKLEKMISKSIFIKNDFIKNDPKEKNIRKSLNFGHTVGHAFESMALARGKNIQHGYAVAYGMVCEAYLSTKKLKFDIGAMMDFGRYIQENYGKYDFQLADIPALIEYMYHDKKNVNQEINFSLLGTIGSIEVNKFCLHTDIEALEFYWAL